MQANRSRISRRPPSVCAASSPFGLLPSNLRNAETTWLEGLGSYFQVGEEGFVRILEDGRAEFLENDSNEQDGLSFRVHVLKVQKFSLLTCTKQLEFHVSY